MKPIEKAQKVAEEYRGQIWDAEVCQYMITAYLDGILADPEAMARVFGPIISRTDYGPHVIEGLKQEVK